MRPVKLPTGRTAPVACSAGTMPDNRPARTASTEAERDGPSVEPHLAAPRELRRPEGEQHGHQRVGEKDPGEAAQEPEQERLGAELQDQPPAGGAEGGADGQLVLSRDGAREDEAGQVRADHEQHQGHRALQDQEERAVRAHHGLLERHHGHA